MSMAKHAAINAVAAASNNEQHLDHVVQCVTAATKRLSQISSASTTNTKSSKRKSRDTVGPWKLGKTLGKGSSGRVRLAKNMETGKLAAIKIVPKKVVRSTNASKKSNAANGNLPYGIEREIIIMKLISHPNIMALYEVWENKSELFLVLEYVEGGELFDYLVSKGKLPEQEAVHYFRQIIQGVAYCHNYNICHRDLKPENLLVDKKNHQIKIADFGMAALETTNKLLETSCGSPHYASPEIVMGKNYHGSPSDVWSCGIILFALLTGHLPFNDDNIKKLLLKVQSGKYHMPQNISSEAQDLISKILIVDPRGRITINEVLQHPLITKYDKARSKSNSDLHLLSRTPQLVTLQSKEDIDGSILGNLQILWHGAPSEYIVARLLQHGFTEEKLFYSLLWQYQERQNPSVENDSSVETTVSVSTGTPTPTPAAEDAVGAPKLLQKSQFSIPSLKVSPKKMKDGYVVSSSRVFKKSVSKRSLPHSTSKKSIPPSVSKRSITPSASKRSLKSSASKKSLYSLQSISKRSVNLNDYLQNDGIPPLPVHQPSSTNTNDLINSIIKDYGTPNKSIENSNVVSEFQVKPQKNEFEMLCEQILFGEELGSIKESKEEEEPSSKGVPAAKETARDTLRKEKAVVEQPMVDVAPANLDFDKTPSRVKQRVVTMPLKDITNVTMNTQPPTIASVITKTTGKPSPDRTLRINSASQRQTPLPSLDPRRSQPNSIETLLRKYSLKNSVASKSNLKKLRNSGDWGTSNRSIFNGSDEGSRLSRIRTDENKLTEPPVTTSTPMMDPSILAQSSTINDTMNSQQLPPGEKKPLLSLPSSMLNTSMTFKNLNQFLNDEDQRIDQEQKQERKNWQQQPHGDTFQKSASKSSIPSTVIHRRMSKQHVAASIPLRKQSTKISLAPKANLTVPFSRKHSQSSSAYDNTSNFDDYSDMSFAMDIPTHTFTAQAFQISNGNSVEDFPANPPVEEEPMFLRRDELASQKLTIREEEEQEEETTTNVVTTIDEDVNIFEDAPGDTTSVATTSSGVESQHNVHRKAVSIDSLNTTNILTPAADVRVSLYGNNAPSMVALPRETTEEIISKFKLSPEKTHVYQQKRFSYQNAELPLSQSLMSMFKDLDEEVNIGEGKSDLFAVKSQEDNDTIELKQAGDKKRVTMLFDDDSSNVFKASPIKPKPKPKPTISANSIKKEPSTSTAVATNDDDGDDDDYTLSFSKGKKKLPTVVECENPVSVKNLPEKVKEPMRVVSDTPKQSWFSKFINNFKKKPSSKGHLVYEHKSLLPFEDLHLLTLRQFGSNSIDYELKIMDKKGNRNRVEYDCRFVQGNFKFKINIASNTGDDYTTVSVKKTKKKGGEEVFNRFNEKIRNLIKSEENKKSVQV